MPDLSRPRSEDLGFLEASTLLGGEGVTTGQYWRSPAGILRCWGRSARWCSDPSQDPVPRRSAANLDSVEGDSTAVLVARLGRLRVTRMREICAALVVAVDCSE